MCDDERFPQTREELLEVQRRLKAQYGQLVDELLADFFQYDPMGISFEENTDEYSPEVRTILPRLRECESADDARRIIHEEFNRWFGGDAGPEARYAAIASQAWQRWQNFNKKEP
jgi:hypothetical protein